ncbi:DMT family transporter [Nonomuraea sp. NPDC050547]|uniref:DMT family transporter n=1 Tax=Nonomuraea sp. NPDC050547 TaxID=3364368 RepID=UPI00378BAB46
MTPISARRGAVYAAIAAAAWGTGGAAGSLLFTTLDPVSVSFWRYLLGAAFLLLPLLLRPTRTRSVPAGHTSTADHTARTRGRTLPTRFGATAASSDNAGDRHTATAANGRTDAAGHTGQPRSRTLFGAAAASRDDGGIRRPITAGNGRVAGPVSSAGSVGPVGPVGSGGSVGDRGTAKALVRVWRVGVVGVGMAVYQAAYFAAIAESGIALATVVTMGATPVLTALGGRFLLNERLSRVGLVALAAALAGLALLTGGGPADGATAGVAWSLLSALGYAAVTLYSRRHNGDPETTAVGGFVVGAACLAPFALAGGILPEFTLASAATLLFLGAVPTALAYALFFRSLTALPAATVSVISLGEAVGAAMIGVVLFSERLTLLAWSGCVLLLAAVVVLTVHGQR